MKFWKESGDWDIDSTCAVVGIHDDDDDYIHNNPCVKIQVSSSSPAGPWWRRTTLDNPEPPLDDENEKKERDATMDKQGEIIKPSDVNHDVFLCGSMDCWNLCWDVNGGTTTISLVDHAATLAPETDSSEEIRDPVDKKHNEDEEEETSRLGTSDPTDVPTEEKDMPDQESVATVPPLASSSNDVRHQDDTRGLNVTTSSLMRDDGIDSHEGESPGAHDIKWKNKDAREEQPVELLEQHVWSFDEQADSFIPMASDHSMVASKRSSSSNVIVNPYEDDNEGELGKPETRRCHAPICKVM